MYNFRFGLKQRLAVIITLGFLLQGVSFPQKANKLYANNESNKLSDFSLFLPMVNNKVAFINTYNINFTQIATSVALPNILFASIENSPELFYSLDGGYNWEPIPTASWMTVTGTNDWDVPVSIAIVPRTDLSVRLLVGVSGRDDGVNGLFRTGDYGATWSKESLPQPILYYPVGPTVAHKYNKLWVSPVFPNRVYLLDYSYFYTEGPRGYIGIVEGGLLNSVDSGMNWSDIGSLTGSASCGYEAVLSSVLENRIYLACGTYAWYQSDDGGQTWLLRSFEVSHLVLDSQDPNRLYGVVGLASGAYDRGYTSIDGGNIWTMWKNQPITCILTGQQLVASATVSKILLERCNDGLFRSMDGGDNWEQLSTISGQLLTNDYGNPGRILWVRTDGLWASIDQGSSWLQLTINRSP